MPAASDPPTTPPEQTPEPRTHELNPVSDYRIRPPVSKRDEPPNGTEIA
jgi:hypothetical protein